MPNAMMSFRVAKVLGLLSCALVCALALATDDWRKREYYPYNWDSTQSKYEEPWRVGNYSGEPWQTTAFYLGKWWQDQVFPSPVLNIPNVPNWSASYTPLRDNPTFDEKFVPSVLLQADYELVVTATWKRTTGTETWDLYVSDQYSGSTARGRHLDTDGKLDYLIREIDDPDEP